MGAGLLTIRQKLPLHLCSFVFCRYPTGRREKRCSGVAWDQACRTSMELVLL